MVEVKGKDEDTDEEIYEVDCIVDVKWAIHKHGVEKGTKPEHLFRTRWKGCGESEDTWEPLTNLDGCEISENSFSFLISPDDAQAHALQIFSADSCVRISSFALYPIFSIRGQSPNKTF